MSVDARDEAPGTLLARIERLGNRLPDPATLFLLGAFAVLVVSELGATLGWSATNPETGEAAGVTSLLSGEGARWVWLRLVDNFTGFAPLGVVLVAMLGIGVAERSGLIGAALKRVIEHAPRRLVTPGVLFAGVMSSIAADAGFVVLPPIAAAIFARLGRSPLLGIALAYVGVAGGFSANLFVTSLDPMLAGATQSAAHLIDPEVVVPVTANYFFMVASVVLVVGVGWVVAAKIVEPSISPRDVEAQIRVGSDARDEDDGDPARERRGLQAAGVTALLVGAGLLALVVVPGAPLHGNIELRPGLEMPAWARALIPLLFVFFVAPGIAYGVARGTVRSDRDVARMMTETMAAMGGYVVLAFFCGQFVAWFSKSGLGTLLALKGIEALSAWQLPGGGLVVAIIVLTATLNLFIGSASAKWFLLAPVFVPLFLGLGVEPELTQAAYRVGDSATNPIAPLNPYIVVIIVFMRRWFPGAGMGTVISLTLPFSASLLFAWTLMLLAWTSLGLPLGP